MQNYYVIIPERRSTKLEDVYNWVLYNQEPFSPVPKGSIHLGVYIKKSLYIKFWEVNETSFYPSSLADLRGEIIESSKLTENLALTDFFIRCPYPRSSPVPLYPFLFMDRRVRDQISSVSSWYDQLNKISVLRIKEVFGDLAPDIMYAKSLSISGVEKKDIMLYLNLDNGFTQFLLSEMFSKGNGWCTYNYDWGQYLKEEGY